MKNKKQKLEDYKKLIVSPEKFRHGDSYIFPFEVLDKTPGGTNLGRIQWHMEFVSDSKQKDGRYYYSKLYVWASQTRDKRYYKKVFEIPCYTECITGGVLGKKDYYIDQVWRIQICDLHKNTVFSAYPQNKHTKLIIPVNSSIFVDPYFE